MTLSDHLARERYDRMDYYRKNLKRAETIHAREQDKGLTDMSVAQTRRMYLATTNLQRWHGRMARAERDGRS